MPAVFLRLHGMVPTTDAFDPTGLGGVDFTQDGSTAVVLEVLSYDFPAGQPVDIEVELYSSGSAVSVATHTINNAITSLTSITLPFANFTRKTGACLLYTSPSPRDKRQSRMPSSA